MSQQTNSGFNAPRFSVEACDPLESVAICGDGMPVSCGRGGSVPRLPSTLVGVGHVVFAALWSVSGARPDSCLALDMPEHFSPSLAFGVGQTCLT
jgi:hypothetical protein